MAIPCTAVFAVSTFASVVLAAETEQDLPMNTFPTTEEVQKQIEKEEPATNAYDEILKGFDIAVPSDPEYPNFPSEYGGTYCKDELLYVCLTDNTPEIQATYLEMVSTPDILRFKTVENSYNDLYNLTLQIADQIGASISTVSVDVYDNAVEVGIPTNTSAKASQNTIARIDDIAKFESSIPVSFVNEEKASSSATELRGGQKICWGSSTGTMTICGTWQGNNAILSAGHCVSVGTTYKHLSSSGATLGTGTFSRYDMDQFYDYGVIKITGTGFQTSNKVINNSNYTTITGKLSSSSGLVGTTVCKYGARKGFGVATINKVDAIVSYSNGPTLYGMSKATFTSGTGYKGDSGGPIYSGHKLYGIYSGDNSNPNDSSTTATYFWYSPIYGAAGFSVKTS